MLVWLCAFLLWMVFWLWMENMQLKRNMDQLCIQLKEHLSTDTNTLLHVSTKNRHIRRFAAQLNEQLRILRKQRQRYLNGGRELKEAITNVSHDLRTPLTAICGYLDLLDEEETTSEGTRYREIIHHRVEYLRQLSEELFKYTLTFSIDQTGKKEPVILQKAIEESLAGHYILLKEQQIEPQVTLPAQNVVCYIDSSILSRILQNLIQNAIKYSDGDLSITLTETRDISFTNTASQLDDVLVGKLFDRYFTVQDGETSTGLGLEITKKLVEQMRGTIMASYHNQQLSITISFPK